MNGDPELFVVFFVEWKSILFVCVRASAFLKQTSKSLACPPAARALWVNRTKLNHRVPQTEDVGAMCLKKIVLSFTTNCVFVLLCVCVFVCLCVCVCVLVLSVNYCALCRHCQNTAVYKASEQKLNHLTNYKHTKTQITQTHTRSFLWSLKSFQLNTIQ